MAPQLTAGSPTWCYMSLIIMLIYAEMRGTYDRKVANIFAYKPTKFEENLLIIRIYGQNPDLCLTTGSITLD